MLFGILNLTPDSFSDGDAKNLELEHSLAKAFELIDNGAMVLDVGAESTRPGASELSEQDELARLLPFVKAFREKSDHPLSIDCRRPAVLKQLLESLDTGSTAIDYINDIGGMQNPEMAELAANYARSHNKNLKVIVMHSSGEIPPRPSAEIADDLYGDGEDALLEDMRKFFAIAIQNLQDAGFNTKNIILDPGLGFGKNADQSMEILSFVQELQSEFKLKALIGASRKSFLKAFMEGDEELAANPGVDALDAASYAYNMLAQQNGVSHFRVHNVKLHTALFE